MLISNKIYSFLKKLFFTKDIYSKILRYPWDFPEIMLLEYLRKSNNPLTMFIIGAYRGEELERIFKTKKISHVTLFEPVPNNVNFLKEKKKKYKDKIKIVEAALSDFDGKILFNETSMLGNGSILKLSELAIQSHEIKQTESFDVAAIKLETYCQTFQAPDILWIDVQGYELNVLKGSESILNKVSLIFIEISIWEPTYKNGCVASELTSYLKKFGFELTQLGTAFLNGTGNALFSKKKNVELEYLKNKV
jgi:FkbM family methyltransferase